MSQSQLNCVTNPPPPGAADALPSETVMIVPAETATLKLQVDAADADVEQLASELPRVQVGDAVFGVTW